MSLMGDMIKDIITRLQGTQWPTNDDNTVIPLDMDQRHRSITPAELDMAKSVDADSRNIFDENGTVVGTNYGKESSQPFRFSKNPFQDLIERGKGEQGTILGALYQLFGNKPIREQKQELKPGTIGPDGSGEVPGTGTDPALNPKPMKTQRMRQFNKRELPPINPNNQDLDRVPAETVDYSMPTALDPQRIEELRQSLLSDSGQRDPTNPNGLAGRMTGPYSKVDQQGQMDEAQAIADRVRNGYNSTDGGRTPRVPRANFQDALKNKLLGGE